MVMMGMIVMISDDDDIDASDDDISGDDDIAGDDTDDGDNNVSGSDVISHLDELLLQNIIVVDYALLSYVVQC